MINFFPQHHKQMVQMGYWIYEDKKETTSHIKNIWIESENDWNTARNTVHAGRSTYKTGGVVVTDGLGVTPGFQRRVSLDDLVLQVTLHIFFFQKFSLAEKYAFDDNNKNHKKIKMDKKRNEIYV